MLRDWDEQRIALAVQQQVELARSLIPLEIDQGIQQLLPGELLKLERVVELELKRTQAQQRFLSWLATGTQHTLKVMVCAPFSLVCWLGERFGELPYSHLLFWTLFGGAMSLGGFAAFNLPCRTTHDLCYQLRQDKSNFEVINSQKTKH